MGLAWRTWGLVFGALAAYMIALLSVLCIFMASARSRSAWDAWAQARLREAIEIPEAGSPALTPIVAVEN